MSTLSSLLILATLAAPASQPREVDAENIFYCNFDSNWDVNYDKWPDKWKRYFGPGRPHYVRAELADDADAVAGRCLTVDSNGGGSLIESPAVAVSEKFGYIVEARLHISRLKYSRVQLRLEFCDENRKVLQTISSKWYRSTNGWTKVRIGPVDPQGKDIRLARVAMYVEGGKRVDLQGKISLDDVWLARIPKMTVVTNSPFNVYTDPRNIVVVCNLSGILERNPDIHFELLDASSQRLEDDTLQLDGRLITERLTRALDIVKRSTSRKAGYEGTTKWRPPIREHGFYRVRVTMRTAQGVMNRHVISIAVVPPLQQSSAGEFGWSLTGENLPVTLEQLPELLPRVAINWVKLSVWYDPSQEHRGDEFVVLTERLSAEDIEVVGVIDHPPATTELGQQFTADTTVADLLSLEPTLWMPLLDPVLTRLSMRVRWWQIGTDRDVSFTGFANLEREIGTLRDRLFRFGQDIRLGIGWQWPNADGLGQSATWDFQQYTATPSLTNEELAEYLQIPQRPDVDRWVLVEPLSREFYDLPTRVHDLVGQMLTAKIYGADAIFIPEPFNDDHGLMSAQGTPGELLLPWRTTASLLSGAKSLGSIQLPQGSENHLFQAADGSVLMVVWNEKPVRETLHLGDKIRIIDVWGRAKTPSTAENRQVIEVDSLPVFVLGLNPFIAKWRMSVRFDHLHIPSVFGKVHPNKLYLQNHFPQGAGGMARLIAPEGWQVVPEKVEFKLATGETEKHAFDVALPFDANSGNAEVRIDFQMAADREYQFSVYRELRVGEGDVEVEVHTRLDDEGSLVVEQRMVNRSDHPVDFKCLLYAADRRRQRKQVFRLGDSQDIKTYLYPNGEELIGEELWLRLEELGGSRVLNHRFKAER